MIDTAGRGSLRALAFVLILTCVVGMPRSVSGGAATFFFSPATLASLSAMIPPIPLHTYLQKCGRACELGKIDFLPCIAFVVHPTLRVPIMRVRRNRRGRKLRHIAKTEHALHDDACIQLAGPRTEQHEPR